ncbi:hypothetical protein [Salegentibacter mishustinae]|uniref:hypothetical protein n=1 Tax=Salegentibacter mishustinae TaxID=270918 RepID=UPI000DB39369|nr:hypothetical protein [Salegentibacter mishustinae]PZX65330.1 hypothetical protein LY54_01623 [Salegentibacter mishustinae]GGW85776.1 hypothetical protein GCM10008086_12530 [Salegentibacter mishustinae]
MILSEKNEIYPYLGIVISLAYKYIWLNISFGAKKATAGLGRGKPGCGLFLALNLIIC